MNQDIKLYCVMEKEANQAWGAVLDACTNQKRHLDSLLRELDFLESVCDKHQFISASHILRAASLKLLAELFRRTLDDDETISDKM